MHLNLKRKRDLSINIVNEEETKEAKKISMQQLRMAAPSTVHELKSICKSHKPSLLFLMETKAIKLSCDEIMRKLCLNNMFCVEFRGLSRRLCIFWKSNKRKQLWKDLTFVNNSLVQPRVVLIEDFIDVISQDEKVGLHPKPSSEIESFRNFVHENALLDLELQGMKYT
ncbi:hypothetical protein Ahy_A08g040886 isoform B [Arachis hypogaea]|uniref:Uncharacterized protein n=1 Tax=Arachis hypogaea TaxID=3818 RepID=A0A445C0X2_ARAHY|nr:hypothetical protein Ahy_A08g040886 isoform B [Arachis hypogaea]